MVFGTVGTGDYGYVIGLEVVAGKEPGCWVRKGLGEVDGKEQGRVCIPGKFGAGILDVSEWSEERCSADFAS